MRLITTLARSCNKLCGINAHGGTYSTEGIAKLFEGIEGSAITSLRCAAAHCAPALLSDPAAARPILARSVRGNQLCGTGHWSQPGEGTYTTEGITKLCDGLKGSAITSLECAAAP